MKTPLLLSFILCILCLNVDSYPLESEVETEEVADPAETTKDVISARQSSIVSFNLGNIAVLLALKGVLLLKALILTPKGINEKFAKRDAGASELTSNPELAIDMWELDVDLAKEFLHSAETGEISCLQRFACENYERAEDYLSAGSVLLSGARVVKFMTSLVPLSRYEFMEQAMIEATRRAREGTMLREDACESTYPCEPHD